MLAINPNYLIDKYGEEGELNGVKINMFVSSKQTCFWNKEAGYNKYKEYSDSVFFDIMVKEPVLDHDIFHIRGTKFFVFKIKEVPLQGEVIYSHVTVFRDDFTRKMKIYYQFIQGTGVNLPSKDDHYIELFARIKTASPNDYMQMPFYQGDVPSHIISILTYRDIKKDTLIVWEVTDKELRYFTVIDSIDLDERNKIRVMNVIENET